MAGRSRISRNISPVVVLLIVMTAGWLAPTRVMGQFYFGKNKVQYTDFNWKVMTTDHFNIYFFVEETEVAQAAARIAEDAYPRLAALFNQEIRKKIRSSFILRPAISRRPTWCRDCSRNR